MKKASILIIASIIALSSCSQPLSKMWTETGKFSITPVTWGKLLWGSQDTYGMSGSNGKPIWTKSLEGVKWTTVTNLDGKLFVMGDNRIIARINETGDILWKIENSPGIGIYPVAVTKNLIITAFDTSTEYQQNPVSMLALDIETGNHTWQLEDHDYSGALTIPVAKTAATHIVIPQMVGDSVFLEGFDLSDGRFLWRKTWDKPPSGQFPVLEGTKDFCWIWKKTGSGIEFGTIDKKTGAVKSVKYQDMTGLVDRKVIDGRLYLKFRSGLISVDSFLNIKKIDGIWFPLCQITGTNKLAVIDNQCTTIAVSDMNLSGAKKAFNVDVCYLGIPGAGLGEVYLYPVTSPVDFPTFRCQLSNPEDIKTIYEIPDTLRQLGKGKTLNDLVILAKKLRASGLVR